MTDDITAMMQRLWDYTVQLRYFIDLGRKERFSEMVGEAVGKGYHLTENDQLRMEEEFGRVRRYVYAWQRKSGQRVSGRPLHHGPFGKKAKPCRPCKVDSGFFDVKAFAKEMRA